MSPATIDCDFLVIGSGIAGLTFALNVSEHGTVVVVTKKNDTESNTNYAQGGIAAVLGGDDNFDLHIRDTLRPILAHNADGAAATQTPPGDTTRPAAQTRRVDPY